MPKARIHCLLPRCHGMRGRAGKRGCEESRIAAQEGEFDHAAQSCKSLILTFRSFGLSAFSIHN